MPTPSGQVRQRVVVWGPQVGPVPPQAGRDGALMLEQGRGPHWLPPHATSHTLCTCHARGGSTWCNSCSSNWMVAVVQGLGGPWVEVARVLQQGQHLGGGEGDSHQLPRVQVLPWQREREREQGPAIAAMPSHLGT